MSGPQEKRNHLKQERYNAIVNRSAKDLNHLKLYKQGASPPQGLFSFILTTFSVIVLGYAEELVHQRHIFLPRSLRLSTPFKVLWTIVKEPDLNISAVCGELILEG
ncbi:hypothetical protein PIB30_066819 [Stylosanthes scabra]|uniref:Uncharacterized protein n=1 Tax=Stylosanthes scabra TaxID=79078 RepID=A0ABU6UME0_9FABA|nr:hypothetical protein [Stylosanthes scabra]